MFNKILSYFLPKIIHKTTSSINELLEVTYVNGKLVLDSKNTNYSYGNLQKVLRKGLQKIGKDMEERREYLANLSDYLIVVNGGNGTLEEALIALKLNKKIQLDLLFQ